MSSVLASPRSRTEDLLEAFERMLSTGHRSATQASEIAAALGVGERMVRALAEELVLRGVMVGSTCSGSGGYFLVGDTEDLAIAVRNLKPRVVAISRRWRALERAAALAFSGEQPEVLRLFDLESAT